MSKTDVVILAALLLIVVLVIVYPPSGWAVAGTALAVGALRG